MTAVAVIPARYASTRFPGKPLADQTGRSLIEHVWRRVEQAETVSRVIVATDDDRIAQAVRGFGGEAVMTAADHPSGTDRVAEVAATLDCDTIVNVQGDEPELEPAAIDRLVGLLDGARDCSVATLACPFANVPHSDPEDPAAVKVVLDRRGRALYFSRSLIPHHRAGAPAGADLVQPLLHLGIYAYRRNFLMELASWPPTPLERVECLEQLRVLENSQGMRVGVVERAAVGIDTPEDYAAFVARHLATEGGADNTQRIEGEHAR